MGWVAPPLLKHLQAEPPIPGSLFLPPGTLKTLKHIGFRTDGAAQFGKRAGDWKVDPVVDKVYKEMGLYEHFDSLSYARIRETHPGGLKGILKYDGPNDDPDVSSKVLYDARAYLYRKFAHLFDTCPLTDDDAVEIPLTTHPGVDFRDQDYKDKGEVMRDPAGREQVLKFWEHPEFPTIWKEAVKGGELLKKKKIDENDSRVFLIPGLSFHWLCVKMLGSQHEKFVEIAQSLSWPIKIGFSFQKGGFSSIFRSLEPFSFVVEGDCIKWDSSLLPWIWFNFILPLRIKLFKPTPEMSREEFAKRLLSVYKDVCYTIVVLPNGQVVVKCRGMPSGFFLTGDDNSLAHLFIKTCMYFHYGKQHLLDTDLWFLAADDHIFGTNDAEIANFENRRSFYARFNVALSPEKDVISSSPEGHTFLGFTAHKHPQTMKWVPVFNLDKALCSALRPGGCVSDGLRYVRICALRILCFYHPKYELVKELARRIYQMPFQVSNDDVPEVSKEVLDILSSFPDDRSINSLWMGDERVGLEGPVLNLEFSNWTLNTTSNIFVA